MTNLTKVCLGEVWADKVEDGRLAIYTNDAQDRFEARFEPDDANEKQSIIDINEGALQTLLDEEGDQWDIGFDLMRARAYGWHKGRLSQHGGAKYISLTQRIEVILVGNHKYTMDWKAGDEWWELRDGEIHFANAGDTDTAERLAQRRYANPDFSQFVEPEWEFVAINDARRKEAGEYDHWKKVCDEGTLTIQEDRETLNVFLCYYTDLESTTHPLESKDTLEEAKEYADDYYNRRFG